MWIYCYVTGADPGFQVRGTYLKELRRAEGGAKIVWVFRVKNHDFTPKNHIFSNFRGLTIERHDCRIELFVKNFHYIWLCFLH
jgi:hypothetical protein